MISFFQKFPKNMTKKRQTRLHFSSIFCLLPLLFILCLQVLRLVSNLHPNNFAAICTANPCFIPEIRSAIFEANSTNSSSCFIWS